MKTNAQRLEDTELQGEAKQILLRAALNGLERAQQTQAEQGRAERGAIRTSVDRAVAKAEAETASVRALLDAELADTRAQLAEGGASARRAVRALRMLHR